jgi:hypothetical protein
MKANILASPPAAPISFRWLSKPAAPNPSISSRRPKPYHLLPPPTLASPLTATGLRIAAFNGISTSSTTAPDPISFDGPRRIERNLHHDTVAARVPPLPIRQLKRQAAATCTSISSGCPQRPPPSQLQEAKAQEKTKRPKKVQEFQMPGSCQLTCLHA